MAVGNSENACSNITANAKKSCFNCIVSHYVNKIYNHGNYNIRIIVSCYNEGGAFPKELQFSDINPIQSFLKKMTAKDCNYSINYV